jgi:cation transporter-like permease
MRSDSISLALLVHVAGAMVLVGGLVTAAAMAIAGWNDEAATLRRLSYRTLLAVALPGYIVMRIGAQWTSSKEHLDNLPNDPTWLGIGYITADAGAVLLLIALIVGGIGMRRSRSGGGGGWLKASSVIATVLVAAYVVTIWAMGAKPT